MNTQPRVRVRQRRSHNDYVLNRLKHHARRADAELVIFVVMILALALAVLTMVMVVMVAHIVRFLP